MLENLLLGYVSIAFVTLLVLLISGLRMLTSRSLPHFHGVQDDIAKFGVSSTYGWTLAFLALTLRCLLTAAFWPFIIPRVFSKNDKR